MGADVTMETEDTRPIGEISFFCGSSLSNRFSVIAAATNMDYDESIDSAKRAGPAPVAALQPTPILVEFHYGLQFPGATHSAVICLLIPPAPPSPANPYPPVTGRQLITEIERKANYPGVLGRSANHLRSVHVVWQSSTPKWVAPTTVIDTLPRVSRPDAPLKNLSYSDPRFYHYNSLPEEYPANKDGSKQWSSGLAGQKGVRRSFDQYGNQIIVEEEKEEPMPSFYHGGTSSPSKWAGRGFHKDPAPTGKWADLTVLNDDELWNTLKLMAVRGWNAHLDVRFEVEIWEPR